MKITDIVQKIENPNLCTAEDVQDFEGLIKKYPYAQSFPILLLKTLGQAKDIHFEDSLNQHAYRVSDRMHLYFLINDISEDVEEVSSSELQVTSSEVKEKIEVVSSSKLQVASSGVEEEIVESEELKVESSEVEDEIEEVSSSVDEDIVRLDYEKLLDQDIKFNKVEEMTFEPVRIHMDDDGEILTVKSDEEEIIESEELKVESSKVEEEIVESEELKVDEITSFKIDEEVEEIPSITIEEEIDAEGADIEVSATELQEANENRGAEIENIGIEFFDPTLEMEISNAVEDLSILKPSSFEEQHKTISLDFIEKKFNQEEDELTSNAISQGFQVTLESEKVASLNEKEAEKKTDISDSIAKFERISSDEKRSFYAWLHANEESTHPEKHDRSTEIIEKFIQEEPSISRSVKEDEQVEKKKTPFFKATEIAKESLKEKRIPVSVTLAQIFESQGNFPKAIDSYEQLMLLYPEKKTFFANQIKKLKKKLNN